MIAHSYQHSHEKYNFDYLAPLTQQELEDTEFINRFMQLKSQHSKIQHELASTAFINDFIKLKQQHAWTKQREKALSQFDSYGLNDLNNANLMNRVDSKFLLPISFLPDLLRQLHKHYKVLDIDGKRSFSYENQYFDTPFMDLYHEHHNGKLNRYKVRKRRYVDTNTEFLEVKLKNNQKRTIKTRIKLDGNPRNYQQCKAFIDSEMNEKGLNLDVNQQSGYQRIALANEDAAERLTLDFDLWYNNRRGNNEVKLPEFFIAELKQNKKSKRSPFYQLMSQNHIFPTSFSKYCIGCALLYPTAIKSNRFKATLAKIETYNRTNPSSFFKSN